MKDNKSMVNRHWVNGEWGNDQWIMDNGKSVIGPASKDNGVVIIQLTIFN